MLGKLLANLSPHLAFHTWIADSSMCWWDLDLWEVSANFVKLSNKFGAIVYPAAVGESVVAATDLCALIFF
jgi:hypothetical protein